MIIGECPFNCGHIFISLFQLGAWNKDKCPKCKRINWLRHSNIDPKRYTSKEFHKQFKIKGREIIKR